MATKFKKIVNSQGGIHYFLLCKVGKTWGWFIVDTGAMDCLLSKSFFKKNRKDMSCKSLGKYEMHTAHGTSMIPFYAVKDVLVKGKKIDIECVVTDLGRFTESYEGEDFKYEVAGILGNSVLGKIGFLHELEKFFGV
jgi:hypothetical protein